MSLISRCGLLLFIVFLAVGGRAVAEDEFKIDDAKYEREKALFKAKGKAGKKQAVTLYDADSHTLIVSLVADSEGNWRYRKRRPGAVPCRLRAESLNMDDEKRVEHADEFPGGCGYGGGSSNTAPMASANGPYSGTTGNAVDFSSSGSRDPDGSLVTFQWDFGDGTFSNDANPSHSYSDAGSYPVSLTVTDNDGATASDTTSAVIDTVQMSGVSINSTSQNRLSANPVPEQLLLGNIDFKLLGTNDLGMHCGDFDTRISSILPPFNVKHAQVIQRGEQPRILTPDDGISVFYSAVSSPDDPVLTGINSGGTGPVLSSIANDGTVYKTNFWDTSPGQIKPTSLAAYRAFYPPGVLDAFAPQPDQGLPAPNVERLYLGDGQLTAEQQWMPGHADPTNANTPQPFGLFTKDQPFFVSFPFGYVARDVNWFEAAGAPLAAFDDQGRENPWPLYRFQAKDTSGNILASTDVVVPISGEANCGACHTSDLDPDSNGSGIATQALVDAGIEVAFVGDDPEYGVSVPLEVSKEYAADLNLVRLHDLKHGTDLVNNTPIVCQSCHYTPALDLAHVGPKGAGDPDANGRQQTNVRSMSNVMHQHHGSLLDENGVHVFPEMSPPYDGNGQPRDPIAARAVLNNTCYQCHPGRRTDCLRGAMADGNMLCQDCHGDMLQVGSDFSDTVTPDNPGDFRLSGDFYTNPDTPRVPWANEPGCGSCHTGDALDNMHGDPGTVGDMEDLIRLVQAYLSDDPKATPIVPDNKRFAENTVAVGDPGAGNPMLYRVSQGHEGIFCEGCHGATHGIWPNKNPGANDNIAAVQLQGHTGTVAECRACHMGDLGTNLGGPHGMHPIGEAGVRFAEGDHARLVENQADECRACHGRNGEGTVLSKMAQDRVLKCDDRTAFCPSGDRILFPNDHKVGCTECHENEL